jgi:hypothetical protein
MQKMLLESENMPFSNIVANKNIYLDIAIFAGDFAKIYY